MSTETVTYNVYRVYFAQIKGPDHEAIALVPAQLPDQGAGRFYHVQGPAGIGMTYDLRPGYRFNATRSFRKAVLQFQIPKTKLGSFEAIATNNPPPHDPRLLTEDNPYPAAKNCTNWVDEVLSQARTL